MNKRQVNIVLSGYGRLPVYKTEKSAGCDIYAANAHEIILHPWERKLIPTGIRIEMPEDSFAQMSPRSGLSLKEGIVAITGIIDSDYRGEVGVILSNQSNRAFAINRGDRVAQMVFIGNGGLFQADFNNVENLSDTDRGESGFGSTGI